jgi:PEP-CTERM motif
VSTATVGDGGSFDVGLALVDQLDQPLSNAPGMSFEMDVQFGTSNTDQGTKFPQATIGGADGFSMSVPEPGTLALLSIAVAGLGLARRR